MASERETIAEIEAILREHIKPCTIYLADTLENGVTGIPEAAAAIAALRAQDREGGAPPAKVLATGWLKAMGRRDGEERGPVVEFVIDASQDHAMTFADIWNGKPHQIAALPLSPARTEDGNA